MFIATSIRLSFKSSLKLFSCKSDQDCVSTNDELTRACMNGFCVLIHGGDIPSIDPISPPQTLQDQVKESIKLE